MDEITKNKLLENNDLRQKLFDSADKRAEMLRPLLAAYEAALNELKKQFYPMGNTKLQKSKSMSADSLVTRAMQDVRKPAALLDAWERADKDSAESKLCMMRENMKALERQEAEAEKERAINYLIKQGKTLGKDFSLNNAVLVANELAADIEIKKQKLIIDIGNLCECGKWHRATNRCHCGAIRVNWETGFDHSFEAPSIHPAKY